MRTLNPREKRTVRLGAAGVALYLVLFGGMQVWKFCERKRVEYGQMLQQAEQLKRDVQLHEARALTVRKIMESMQMDPAGLSTTTIVAQASAAIQKAATSSGIQVGPMRESPARPSSKELASMQFEGTGPVPAVVALLHRLETIGFPLIIETAQFTPAAGRPGQLKVNLTILVLDFEQWQKEEAPHA